MSSQQDEVFARRGKSADRPAAGSETEPVTETEATDPTRSRDESGAEPTAHSGPATEPVQAPGPEADPGTPAEQSWTAPAPQSWAAPAPKAWAGPGAGVAAGETASDEPTAGEPAGPAATESAAAQSAAAQSAAPEPGAGEPPAVARPTPTFSAPVAPGGPGQAFGSDQAVGGAQADGFGQPARVGKLARSPWRTSGGKTVFRRGTPFVLFWVWVAFAIYNVIEIAFPDHNYFSLELTFGLLTITGLMYACALRPRLVADDDGIVVHNPFRDHLIRWGALSGVYLGDSVELACARPEPKKDKTVYCWALYSGRRSRDRSRMRAMRSQSRGLGFGGGQGTGAARTQAELSDLAKKDTVELMAAELGHRSTAARERGAPAAVLESRWAWLPVASVLLPAVVLLVLVLAR